MLKLADLLCTQRLIVSFVPLTHKSLFLSFFRPSHARSLVRSLD